MADRATCCGDYCTSVVCVGGVDGSVYAFASGDGTPLATCKLPGAVFSSPSVCASRVIVGARDDRLYCLELRERTPPAARADGAREVVQEDEQQEDEQQEEQPVDPKLAKKLAALARLLGGT